MTTTRPPRPQLHGTHAYFLFRALMKGGNHTRKICRYGWVFPKRVSFFSVSGHLFSTLGRCYIDYPISKCSSEGWDNPDIHVNPVESRNRLLDVISFPWPMLARLNGKGKGSRWKIILRIPKVPCLQPVGTRISIAGGGGLLQKSRRVDQSTSCPAKDAS